MANFNLTQFQAEVLGGTSLARTNRFEVLINPPASLVNHGSLVSLYVEQTNFPMLTVGAKPFRIHNSPVEQRPSAIEHGGEGIMFNVHLDAAMEIKRFFDNWIYLIIKKDNFLVNYANNYMTSILIRQLDEQDNITYEVELIDAFPRNVNLIPLDHNAVNQTHKLNVLIAYRYWRETLSSQPIDVPLPIQHPQVPRTDNRTFL